LSLNTGTNVNANTLGGGAKYSGGRKKFAFSIEIAVYPGNGER